MQRFPVLALALALSPAARAETVYLFGTPITVSRERGLELPEAPDPAPQSPEPVAEYLDLDDALAALDDFPSPEARVAPRRSAGAPPVSTPTVFVPVGGDDVEIHAVGPGPGQLTRALDALGPALLSCGTGAGTVLLEVGLDAAGTVRRVAVLDDPGVAAPGCVERTLEGRRLALPEVPDGFTFHYALEYVR